MGNYLTLLIIIPLLGALFEIVNARYFRIVTGIFSLAMSVLVLCFTVFFVWKFAPSSATPQLLDYSLWIPDWGISYKLGLDGLNTAGLILVSVIFFVFSILSFRDIKPPLFYIMMMLLESSVIGFILSYDLILKILFWELSWIPVFFILLRMEKQSISLFFSKFWFVSELLLVLACVFMFNKITGTYDLEKIMKTQVTPSGTNKVVFLLFILSIFMRAAVFPFDSWLIKSLKNTNSSSALITGVVVVILPFFFFTHVVSTVFYAELTEYFDILSTVLLVGISVNVVRLFLSRTISTLITTQILLFNSLMMLFLIKPDETILQAFTEVLVIKSMINILIICFGKKLIELSRKAGSSGLVTISPFVTWAFVLPVVLSFGIPGLTMAKPVLLVISKWYTKSVFLSSSAAVLVIGAFLLSSLNIAHFFKKTDKKPVSLFSYKYVIIISIVVIITAFISIKPAVVHKFAGSYYTNILADRGY
ncbi:MAG: hypothetical protein JXA66_03295 [Oligoflexia bacterium]|nr:hypothetical protein [Oligoflexia bacterium]